MPKYEALFLLYDRKDEKDIYPGDVFEVTDPTRSANFSSWDLSSLPA